MQNFVSQIKIWFCLSFWIYIQILVFKIKFKQKKGKFKQFFEFVMFAKVKRLAPVQPQKLRVRKTNLQQKILVSQLYLDQN
jgi:hypothetical protein